jgi:integrase
MAMPEKALYTIGSRDELKNVPFGVRNFLNRKGADSENTLIAYEKDVTDFFMAMHKKDIDQLTVYDLIFEQEDIERYQSFLGEHYKGASVNRKINTIRSLFNHFEANKYFYYDKKGDKVFITASAFLDIEPFKTNDSEGSGMIYHDEVKAMLEKAKTLPNGEEKALALELLSVTSFRVSAVVDLKWSNFRKEKDTWVIKVVDKQKIHEKPIREDLYERLVNENNRKNDLLSDNNKVFSFKDRKTLERTVNEVAKLCGFDEDRDITPHSFKKYGMYEVHLITNGNFEEVAKQGNHSSYETSMRYYMQFRKDYASMPCLMIGQEIDDTIFDELDREQIVNLLKNSSRAIKFQLVNSIKNMQNK